jgi:hypothetical protein
VAPPVEPVFPPARPWLFCREGARQVGVRWVGECGSSVALLVEPALGAGGVGSGLGQEGGVLGFWGVGVGG